MILFRRIVEEFEARLRPASGLAAAAAASGKVEKKTYGDGWQRLSVKARGLDLAEGTGVSVNVDGTVIANGAVSGGRLRIKIDGSRQTVPQVSDGQSIDLRAGEAVLLRGIFEPD